MSVFLIVKPKHTLVASHTALWWVTASMLMGKTDRRTDGQMLVCQHNYWPCRFCSRQICSASWETIWREWAARRHLGRESSPTAWQCPCCASSFPPSHPPPDSAAGSTRLANITITARPQIMKTCYFVLCGHPTPHCWLSQEREESSLVKHSRSWPHAPGTHYHLTLAPAVLWTLSNDSSRPTCSDSLNLMTPAPLYLWTLQRYTNAILLLLLLLELYHQHHQHHHHHHQVSLLVQSE